MCSNRYMKFTLVYISKVYSPPSEDPQDDDIMDGMHISAIKCNLVTSICENCMATCLSVIAHFTSKHCKV